MSGSPLDDAGNPDAELLTHHHHFAFSEAAVSHVDVDGLAHEAVQLNHRPSSEGKNFLDGHARPPQLDGHGHGQVEDRGEGGRVRGRALVFQFPELRGSVFRLSDSTGMFSISLKAQYPPRPG